MIDRSLLNKIIEQGDQSLFQIPPQSHLIVQTGWPFTGQNSSSFVGVMHTQVSQLVNEFKSLMAFRMRKIKSLAESPFRCVSMYWEG